MKRSRRELSIDIVIHWGVFKTNKITLFPCFTCIPKPGVSFHYFKYIQSIRCVGKAVWQVQNISD